MTEPRNRALDTIMTDDLGLLVKLGSIARHCVEGLSSNGHHFDLAAIESLANDPQVREWMVACDELGLLPVPR
jgi:hypothetical protein